MKLDLELNVPIRGNWFSQVHLHYRVIIFVVVVGMNILQLRSKIALPYDFEASDLHSSVTLGIPFFKVLVARSFAFAFAHPSCCRLKRIQIKMKRKCILSLSREIVIRKYFGSVERVSFGIVLRVHVVSHYSLG